MTRKITLVSHKDWVKGPPDPRDPDHSREGIFVTHNCWLCASGSKPCQYGNPSKCEQPIARND